jgi:hypothetical protein
MCNIALILFILTMSCSIINFFVSLGKIFNRVKIFVKFNFGIKKLEKPIEIP